MAWSFETSQPLYLQIADRLRAEIIRGRYAPGDRMPSVRDLAYEAAVNPNTMQRAVGELERDALIVTRGTSGRFITEDTGVLTAARSRYLTELTEHFFTRIRMLGVSEAEIAQYLQAHLKEERQHGTDSHMQESNQGI